MNNWKNN